MHRDGIGQYQPNGPTQLKRRLLRAGGWRVVSVPFFEWNNLGGEPRRREYLEARLSSQ